MRPSAREPKQNRSSDISRLLPVGLFSISIFRQAIRLLRCRPKAFPVQPGENGLGVDAESRRNLLGKLDPQVFRLKPGGHDGGDLPGELVEELPQPLNWNQQPASELVGLLLQPVAGRIVALEVPGRIESPRFVILGLSLTRDRVRLGSSRG